MNGGSTQTFSVKFGVHHNLHKPIPSQESKKSCTCLLVVSTTQKQQMATIEGMKQRHYWHTGCHHNYHVNGKTKQTTTKYNNIANQSTTPDI
jgi:hypothetical protein